MITQRSIIQQCNLKRYKIKIKLQQALFFNTNHCHKMSPINFNTIRSQLNAVKLAYQPKSFGWDDIDTLAAGIFSNAIPGEIVVEGHNVFIIKNSEDTLKPQDIENFYKIVENDQRFFGSLYERAPDYLKRFNDSTGFEPNKVFLQYPPL